MTNPETKPIGADAWRTHLHRTGLLQQHELTLTGVSGDGDVFTLHFMAPHQADADLDDIHTRIAAGRPAGYPDHMIHVRRTDLAEGTPPRIDVAFIPSYRADQGRFTKAGGPVTYNDWGIWVENCNVLLEFELTLADVRVDPLGRRVDLRLLSKQRPVNVDDLRSQLPRIAARLDNTSFAGAHIVLEHGTLDDDGVPLVTLALRLPPLPEQPADPWAHAGDTTEPGNEPTQPGTTTVLRRGFRNAFDGALIMWWRAARGTDTEVPPGFPDSAYRHAGYLALGGLAAGVCLLATYILAVMVMILGKGLAGIVFWIHDAWIAQVVLTPITRWLAWHTLGTGASPHEIVWLWGAMGVATFLLGAMHRSIGARIGWCVWGALSIAMAFLGAIGPGAPTIAGIAACWWTALSVIVFRRHRPPQPRGTSWAEHLENAVTDLIRVGAAPNAAHQVDRARTRAERTYQVDVDEPQLADTLIGKWEELLADAGMPGTTVVSEPYDLPTGDTMAVHLRLPIAKPGTRFVRTLATLESCIPQIELLLAQRMPELFPDGIVTPGVVRAQPALLAGGGTDVQQVLLTVYMGTVLDPGNTEQLAADITEIVQASGVTGISMLDLHVALMARGYRTITRSTVQQSAYRLARSLPGKPNVVTIRGDQVMRADRPRPL